MSNLGPSLSLFTALSLAACVMPHGDGIGDDTTGDDTTGDDTTGDDTVDPPPPQPHAATTYHLTSDLEVSASTILPGTLYDVLDLLRTFETSPGEALLDAAELAGVPAIETLRDALPDVLESRLVGWIDDRLEGTGFTVVAGQIVDLADTSFGQVELGSTLDLAAGVHALDTVAVVVAGHRAELPVESPIGGALGLSADVTVTTTGSALAISDHRFGVRVGTAAWNALTAAIETQFGADLATVIATAIDCPGLATTISNKCVLGACVGHRTELLAVCNGAVDYVVDQIHDQFTAVDFDAVILHAGTATCTDADADLEYETIAGTWTAELDLGAGPRPVPATFTGVAE